MQGKPTLKRIGSSRRDAGIRATCEHCGDVFAPKRQTQGRFCSRDCYWAWWGKHRAARSSAKGTGKLERLRREGRDPRSTPEVAWKRKMAYRSTALAMAPQDPDSDDAAWAERGEYWAAEADPGDRPVPRWCHRREPRPLVLAGHGVRLRVHYGALVVRHGFTHYPQKTREDRLFPGDPRLPSRIIMVNPDGYLSLDVVSWLSLNEIPLIVLGWRGQVVSVMGAENRMADPGSRWAQIEAAGNQRGVEIAAMLVRAKLQASIETLRNLPTTAKTERGIAKLHIVLAELDQGAIPSIDGIRIIEARGAVAYFTSWRDLRLRWKGTAHRPIPPEWERIPLRQSLLRRSNRNATHPLNAMLNYGYGVLEGQIRIAAAAAGLDQSVGFLHTSRPGRTAFVYDLMEPLRPVTDRAVLEFALSRRFESGDFTLTDSGVCRLHPQLARLVAQLVARSLVTMVPTAMVSKHLSNPVEAVESRNGK